MPLLGPQDPLRSPARILVGGTSGAGKSTLARRLADVLEIAYVELDALRHGPDWVQRPEFAADVAALAARSSWITEYQYASARPVLLERADLVVYLLFARSRVMRQLVRRTAIRSLRRQRLWNGNVEPSLRTFFTDRDHVVRWAWRTHGTHPGQVEEILRARPELPVVVLRTRADVRRWLSRLARLGSR